MTNKEITTKINEMTAEALDSVRAGMIHKVHSGAIDTATMTPGTLKAALVASLQDECAAWTNFSDRKAFDKEVHNLRCF